MPDVCTAALGISSACGALRDHRLDLPVGGRDDLHAAVEVHLVAVVRRRIVRRGDLHARAGAEMARAERHHRRRDRGEHQRHHEAFCGKHFGGREGELLGAVPGVAADHDRASRRGHDPSVPGRRPRWSASRRRGSFRPARRASVRADRRCRRSADGRTAPRVPRRCMPPARRRSPGRGRARSSPDDV